MTFLEEKKTEEENSLGSHSPLLFQGCYKYLAKPSRTAALQLRGRLVPAFAS